MLRKSLKVLVCLAGIFVACTVIDVLYRFYDLRNNIVVALRAADLESDQELRKKVYAVAIRAGITCEERDILVERSDSLVRAELPYRHRIGIPFSGERRGGFSLPLRASGERAL
jgi:hypothetical protein